MSKYENSVLYHTSEERRKEILQEEIENNFQPVKIDLKEYALAMEHIENLFTRLCSQKKLGEQCKDCALMTAVTALKEFAQSEQCKVVERNLGFNLPE
jgi:hypothetical protein